MRHVLKVRRKPRERLSGLISSVGDCPRILFRRVVVARFFPTQISLTTLKGMARQ